MITDERCNLSANGHAHDSHRWWDTIDTPPTGGYQCDGKITATWADVLHALASPEAANAGYGDWRNDTALDRAIYDYRTEAAFRQRQHDEFVAVSPTGRENKRLMLDEAEFNHFMTRLLEQVKAAAEG